ncbi:ankyrin repeat, SAM and basic leucine zipper domain-containing protein 1 [Arapaima gigas]
MQSQAVLSIPAGDESDLSDYEWDVGYRTSVIQNAAVPALGSEQDCLCKLKKAISSGDVGLLEQLLDAGVDVDYRLSFDWTLLMCAVHSAHYELAKLLLDRGASANFSKDQYTVLMVACMASATEDKIVKCVELLLSRNANPNTHNSVRRTPLMIAAKEGYCQVLNVLVSFGADINAQDSNGYTALAMAVQHGREEAVLKLLQLGAHRNTRTKTGQSPAHLAKVYRRAEISHILASQREAAGASDIFPTEESPQVKGNSEQFPILKERFNDIDLFLCGLNLEHLSETILDNDVTWSDLLTMDREDLKAIGVVDPEDQRKLLRSFRDMHVDHTEVDAFLQLEHIDSCEELYNFLASLRHQCCYLTETVQDVIRKFPKKTSQVVFALDPKKECQKVCSDLVVLTGDLQKEVTCLRSLFIHLDPEADHCWLQPPAPRSSWQGRVVGRCVLGVLSVGLLVFLCRSFR